MAGGCGESGLRRDDAIHTSQGHQRKMDAMMLDAICRMRGSAFDIGLSSICGAVSYHLEDPALAGDLRVGLRKRSSEADAGSAGTGGRGSTSGRVARLPHTGLPAARLLSRCSFESTSDAFRSVKSLPVPVGVMTVCGLQTRETLCGDCCCRGI